ncbi:MAG: aminoacyl-tRNA hydrolase [Candidatus Spechtbacterales bacterium]
MNKILIAGLGNPGKQYKNTPHNIGFEVLDRLLEAFENGGGAIKETHAREAAVWELSTENTKLILVKPLLYMNLSGIPVSRVAKSHEIDESNSLWIVHDDVDLDAGVIKVKKGGRSAGHKGVENIIKALGKNDFWRFRAGIRPADSPAKRPPGFMEEFVTKKLLGEDLKTMRKSADVCAEMVLESLENGIRNKKRILGV